MCAWIIERFCAWSDCDGDPACVFSRDEMLAACDRGVRGHFAALEQPTAFVGEIRAAFRQFR